jgi:hypothetical protein
MVDSGYGSGQWVADFKGQPEPDVHSHEDKHTDGLKPY